MPGSVLPDNRFLALRAAAQDATDFELGDDGVAKFIELRDGGADQAEMAEQLSVEPAVIAELVRADEAQALAHRIATGEEPMYPVPPPEQRVTDTRVGSEWLPIALVVGLLLIGIVYALVR
jgi:hypothetical protein